MDTGFILREGLDVLRGIDVTIVVFLIKGGERK